MLRHSPGIERRGPMAGITESEAGLLDEPARILPGRPRVAESALVVVSDHLLQVGPVALQRLQPLCREPMLVGTAGTWNLSVGDVANESVVERIPAPAGDRYQGLLSHELLAFQSGQTLAHHVLR